MDIEKRFSIRWFNYLIFFITFFFVIEINNIFIEIIYLFYGLGLLGEEDEVDVGESEYDVDEMIEQVKEYSKNFVAVLRDSDFLDYYFNNKVEGSLPLNVEEYNNYEFDRDLMCDYLNERQDESNFSLNDNINYIYNIILFNNILNKNNSINNFQFNFNYIFLDLNILSGYDWIFIDNEIKKKQKYKLDNNKNVNKWLKDYQNNLIFRQIKEIKEEISLTNLVSIKESLLFYGLHRNNLITFFMQNMHNYLDIYIYEIMTEKILVDDVLIDSEWREGLKYLKNKYNLNILDELYDIDNLYNLISTKYYYCYMIKQNINNKLKIYDYNYSASYFNLSFIELPWQKKERFLLIE